MSAAIRREARREGHVPSRTDDRFCDVCHYYATHCRCAGARLYLRERIEKLEQRIASAVAHLDRAIDAEQRPAAVLQGDAQLARHALTGASSRAALSSKRATTKRAKARRA